MADEKLCMFPIRSFRNKLSFLSSSSVVRVPNVFSTLVSTFTNDHHFVLVRAHHHRQRAQIMPAKSAQSVHFCPSLCEYILTLSCCANNSILAFFALIPLVNIKESELYSSWSPAVKKVATDKTCPTPCYKKR